MDLVPIDRFSGSYPHTVDGKNRVTVPSKWRSEPLPELFALADRKLGIIKLMPKAERDRRGQRVLANPKYTAAQAKEFRRHLFGSTPECPLDKEGRILLPADLMAQAGLTKEVTLVGAGETIEVWDRANWKRRQEEFSPQFDLMVEEDGL